ncbi:hypothetical protein [Xenorhabdus japonica]|uniref:hypothetical protein n=1 Tax=Xenorhabdus japonica TaxID=53341 RepID=UPI00111439AA|nr:hypothetical protein [Xenorhabdus japonica]
MNRYGNSHIARLPAIQVSESIKGLAFLYTVLNQVNIIALVLKCPKIHQQRDSVQHTELSQFNELNTLPVQLPQIEGVNNNQ